LGSLWPLFGVHQLTVDGQLGSGRPGAGILQSDGWLRSGVTGRCGRFECAIDHTAYSVGEFLSSAKRSMICDCVVCVTRQPVTVCQMCHGPHRWDRCACGREMRSVIPCAMFLKTFRCRICVDTIESHYVVTASPASTVSRRREQRLSSYLSSVSTKQLL
jgi:hypothetical protein